MNVRRLLLNNIIRWENETFFQQKMSCVSYRLPTQGYGSGLKFTRYGSAAREKYGIDQKTPLGTTWNSLYSLQCLLTNCKIKVFCFKYRKCLLLFIILDFWIRLRNRILVFGRIQIRIWYMFGERIYVIYTIYAGNHEHILEHTVYDENTHSL